MPKRKHDELDRFVLESATYWIEQIQPEDPQSFAEDYAEHLAEWLPKMVGHGPGDAIFEESHRAFEAMYGPHMPPEKINRWKMGIPDCAKVVDTLTKLIFVFMDGRSPFELAQGASLPSDSDDDFAPPGPTSDSDDANSDLSRRWAQFTVEVWERIYGKAFNDVAELREWAAAVLVLLEWSRAWKHPVSTENVAYRVHEIYAAYRQTVNDPGGLRLPAEETMTPSQAISHLDALVQRLLVVEALSATFHVEEIDGPSLPGDLMSKEIRELRRLVENAIAQLEVYPPGHSLYAYLGDLPDQISTAAKKAGVPAPLFAIIDEQDGALNLLSNYPNNGGWLSIRAHILHGIEDHNRKHLLSALLHWREWLAEEAPRALQVWSKILTKKELSAALGITEKTLNTAIEKGAYKVESVGREQFRIDLATVPPASLKSLGG